MDKFGDAVLCAKLPFDTWRQKHDDCQLAIVERAHHSHTQCDAEVFGLFRHLVPTEVMGAGGELETVRARSGKVPDLCYQLPTASTPTATTLRGRGRATLARTQQGQPTRQLAELKVINAGPSRYPAGRTDKAVDRRARLLPGEYNHTLAVLYRRFNGTTPQQMGPLQRRLEELVGEAGLQGLVVGRWSEGSQHLHNLVQGLAEGRALHEARM